MSDAFQTDKISGREKFSFSRAIKGDSKNTKNKLFLTIIISVCGMSFAGCSASFSTGNNGANIAKPTNTASSPATNKAANSTAAKNDKPKPALANEKKPEGISRTAKKGVPVPADWIYVYDAAKGYGFSVPAGTTGGSETQEGVDTFVASTPAPSKIGVVVIAFKDKEMTKEDLLDVAVKFMEGMGEKVQPGKLTGESDDYSLAEATSTSADGTKSKSKILVGTDVTDNYVMIVAADEAKFAANEKIIDEIWGSFDMWSGGASNN